MRLHKLYSEGVGGAAVEFPGGTETVVATVEGITTDVGSREVFIVCNCYWKQSAETTKTVLKVRRGTTNAGTEVAKVELDAVVSKVNELTFSCRDVVGETANGSYVVTLTETKAGQKPESLNSRIRAEF